MFKYIKIIFEKFIEGIALVILIVCTTLGGVCAYKSSERVVTGLILGLIVGMLINIFVFGNLIVLIKINNNIEEIKNNISSLINDFEVTKFENINKTIIDCMKKRFEDIEKEKKEKINYM